MDTETEDGDLLDGVVKHRLARPVLCVLAAADRPLRYGDLHDKVRAMVAGGPRAHAKTLDSALRYLREHGLISRLPVPPRSTEYTINSFGREIVHALGVFRTVEHRHRRRPVTGGQHGPTPPPRWSGREGNDAHASM